MTERLGVRSFAATTSTIRQARRFVRASLESAAVGSTQIADAELAVSELVSNAIEHGSGTDYHVSVTKDDREFVVEVSSTHCGPNIADPTDWRPPEPGVLSGRGLGLVKSLSAKIWSVHEGGILTIGFQIKD